VKPNSEAATNTLTAASRSRTPADAIGQPPDWLSEASSAVTTSGGAFHQPGSASSAR
jgi:hypothetical protein